MAKKSEKTALYPTVGQVYVCEECGMSFEITQPCECRDGPGAVFTCCGEPMTLDCHPT